MCWDREGCLDFACLHRTCCRTAVAGLKYSQEQLDVAFDRIFPVNHVVSKELQINRPKSTEEFGMPQAYSSVNTMYDIENEMKNNKEKPGNKTIDVYDYPDRSLSIIKYRRLWYTTYYPDLNDEACSDFRLRGDGYVDRQDYYNWLRALRLPQKWWENSCEYIIKTMFARILGFFLNATFGLLLFLMLYIPSTLLYVIIPLPKFICSTPDQYPPKGVKKFGGVFTLEPSFFDVFYFTLYRLPTYLVSMSFRTVWYFAWWFCGTYRTALMPDGLLLAALLSSPIVRDVEVKIRERNKNGIIEAKWQSMNFDDKGTVKDEFTQEVERQLKQVLFSKNASTVAEKLQPNIKVTEYNTKILGYRLQLSHLPSPSVQDWTLLPGHYLQAKSIQFFPRPDGSGKVEAAIAILDDVGNICAIRRPERCEKEHDCDVKCEVDYQEKLKKWELAKAHVQIMLCWYPPGWSHNFVHFHFLDLILQRVDITTTRQSVLGTLLRAHVKYQSVLNVAGVAGSWTNPATDPGCSSWIPWKIQPVNHAPFANAISQNTVYHYLNIDKENQTVKIKNVFPPPWVRERRWYGPNNSKNHPMAAKWRGISPYLDMCADYYYVIRRFVRRLFGPLKKKRNWRFIKDEEFDSKQEEELLKDPKKRFELADFDSKKLDALDAKDDKNAAKDYIHQDTTTDIRDAHLIQKLLDTQLIEHDMYELWIHDLDMHGLPGISKVDRIDVIASFIWTASFQHAADHIIYHSVYKNWPMYTAKKPYHIEPTETTWKDLLWNGWTSIQYAAFKTRTCTEVFVGFHYSFLKFLAQDMLTSPRLYSNWKYVQQKDKIPLLKKIHRDFLKDLDSMNKNWGWLVDINTIPASPSF